LTKLLQGQGHFFISKLKCLAKLLEEEKMLWSFGEAEKSSFSPRLIDFFCLAAY